MVEYGTVKFFDGRNSKQYGFISVIDSDGNETGEEIFFHFNDGQFVGNDGFDVYFDGTSRTVDGQLTRLQPPSKDDRIVFERMDGAEGRPKANPWSYADAWDEQDEKVQARAAADSSGEPFDYEGDEDDLEEDDDVSEQEIFGRAFAHLGDAELAREAASMYQATSFSQ